MDNHNFGSQGNIYYELNTIALLYTPLKIYLSYFAIIQ